MAYRYKRSDEQSGEGFMDIVKAGVNKIKTANNFLKNTKVVSRTLKLAGHVTGNQTATDWGNKAQEYGYGTPGYVDINGGTVVQTVRKRRAPKQPRKNVSVPTGTKVKNARLLKKK